MGGEGLTATIIEAHDERWAQFVAGHPDALPFHEPRWLDTLHESYGFRPFVVALVDPTGAVTGGVPLMDVRDPVRGRRWMALPFTDRCPPLVARPAAAGALADGIAAAAADAGVSRVQVRAALDGWKQTTVATVHDLDLSPDTDTLLRGLTPATRRNVRKAQREGVVVRRAESEHDLVDVYYALHLRTRRRLGVPVQPRQFFRTVWRRMLEPGGGHLLLAVANGAPVAGAVYLRSGRTVIYKYGASDERAWRLRPNNALFWEAIRGAADEGFSTFDFGRSDFADAGLRSFKIGWGAVERGLVYSAPPGAKPWTGPSGGRLLAGVIRRAPLGVCRLVGESLYRYAA